MAVRPDGIIDDDENGEENSLFLGGDFVVYEPEIPQHLRDLAAAAQLGDLDALRVALDNLDGSIDEVVEDGDTALHLVCLYGHFSCVQLLLEKGANLEAKDDEGAIPLHDACAGGFTEIVQLLLSSANSPECVKRMLETVDTDGDTPLHHAARGEHADVIRLLLEFGASPTKMNVFGKIPGELPDPNTEAREILEAAASVFSSS
ncbi:hypothetical protein K2173_019381 [Erythroxylum novogranatense]|uniref:Uncharacterized protein n=1 Tax=Erythroxylum novogranatense TaxID=1862640 RepID=A0AAV8UDS3_9ROSI|nr:hypothetical protein K2173_019381 [Erythroxylum novogranatense]